MFTPMFHGQNRQRVGFVPPIYTPQQAYWDDVKISNNSKYISAIYRRDGESNKNIMYSIDFGRNFSLSQTFSIGDIRHIGISGDGKYQLVGGYNTKLFMSSNYGVTFSQLSSSGSFDWRNISLNNDGSIIFAREIGGLWKSDDYGISWTKIFDGTGDTVAISQDGQYVYTNYIDGSIERLYKSSNYGVTFVRADLPFGNNYQPFNDIATDHSGTYVATTNLTGVAVSSNYGYTFTNNSLPDNSFYVKVSGDGSFIIAGDYLLTYRKYSTDYGNTWQNTTSITNANFEQVEIAKDSPMDQILYWDSSVELRYLYRTTDNGATFYEIGIE